MFKSLSDWLDWQATLHPSTIDLGLERVRKVLQRLQWPAPSCPVITIAGTKGKGSCAAMLESIYQAAGYRTGLFTSPHLHRYNERIRIDAREISDESLCVAFERINQARGDISLTYFEFNTLAALLCFATAGLDVLILEVGMGGRLDAVNVVDADVALITSIGLDHTEWLGNDVESIGREKAGIMRAARPALFGSKQMPHSIAETARLVGATLLRAGEDFSFVQHEACWDWRMGEVQLQVLPLPGIAGEVQLWNASAALAAINLLKDRLPVAAVDIAKGLREVCLAGRFQVIAPTAKRPAEWILDVAHNPLSATILAEHLRMHSTREGRKRMIAIFGVLADKDLQGMFDALCDQVDQWIAVGLAGPRALSAKVVADRLREQGAIVLDVADGMSEACEIAYRTAQRDQRVLVFGSFMSVGPALEWLTNHS